ncbi:MAG: type II toxin-antitoxin system prevent-host-death family antitoxin [Kineosporiaceae bacterium]
MRTVNVQDAKTNLSKLLAAVEAGETITIARAGRAVAQLVPAQSVPSRTFGVMHLSVPDNFDAPLPESELAVWE